MSKSAWLIVALLIFLFLFVLILADQTPTEVAGLRSRGTIKSEFKVYGDMNRTAQIETVDWGVLEPAQNQTVTVYLIASSVEVNASNFVPLEAQNFLQLTSEYQNGELQLTLHVSALIQNITDFSFDIIITKK